MKPPVRQPARSRNWKGGSTQWPLRQRLECPAALVPRGAPDISGESIPAEAKTGPECCCFDERAMSPPLPVMTRSGRSLPSLYVQSRRHSMDRGVTSRAQLRKPSS